MAEGLQSRLVRCPKCRNLLTELPGFSIYQCGGCSAVLRAKTKALNGGDNYDKLESLSESEEGISMNRPKSNTLSSREKARVFRERASDVMINACSVDSNNSIINRRRMIMREKQKGFETSWEHNGVSGTHRPYVRPQHVDELVNKRGVDRMMGGECSNSNSYGYGRIRRDHGPLDGSTTTRIANLEHDRAQLLRKVDVLSQQLNNTHEHYAVSGSDRVCQQYGHHGHMHQMERAPLHNKVMIPAPFPHSQQQSPRGYFSSNFSQEHRFESQPAAYSCSMSASSHGYNTRGNGYGSHPQIHPRWQGGVNSNVEDNNPRRKVAAQRNRRLCRPIACGAPFIVCCACFELLKLSKKTLMQEKNKLKVRCGSCSVVLMLEFQSKKLMVSVCEETTESHVNIVDGSCENGANVCEHSGDVEVQSATLNESIPTEEQVLTCESEKKNEDHAFSSSSSSCSPSASSGEEESLEEMVVPREVSSPTDLSVKDDESPSMRTLQYQENLIDSRERMSLQRKGDRIIHTRDQTNDSRITSRQSSRKEEEFSFNDYVNMDSSVDFIDTSKSKPAPIHRWIETSFAGVFKKSLRDLAKPPQQAKNNSVNNKKANVFVNGQPIHEQTLATAEKLAGLIHAGDYWYDIRAGFWGVMGQPCLGVIPPFIEEFNYPMPRNCAAGNTGVFVNGRELHQQDLELLCKRGLPPLEHKFYTLEIDGRLYDNDTGKELHGIGKLAPTVEKVKRGFGMRVPFESVVE